MKRLVPEPRGRIVRLAVTNALYQAGVSVDLAITGVAGLRLAPDASLATLPFALIMVVAAVAAGPAAAVMARYGARAGFMLGACVAAFGGLVSMTGVRYHQFAVFCVGTGAIGVYQAFAGYYRYVAADEAAPEARARAISTVLVGGLAAAALGPLLAAGTKDLLGTEFLGSYALVTLLACGALAVLWSTRLTRREKTDTDDGAPAAHRRIAVLTRPVFVTGVAGTALGYFVMVLLMTAAPIAAVQHHHTVAQGAMAVQWHMVGMYAPALFSGLLITKVGALRVLVSGAALAGAGALAAIAGTALPNFMAALFLVGVGWHFMYVSGSALVAASYGPGERSLAQGVGEGLTMLSLAVGALSAGVMLNLVGWRWTSAAALVPLAVCLGVSAAYAVHNRRARADVERGRDTARLLD